MEAKLIIALVVVIAIAAHVALYRWVRFKIDESVVLQFLRDSDEAGQLNCHSTEAISTHTALPTERIAKVCDNSNEIAPHPDQADCWQLGHH
jgi:hypothetical protein